MLGEAKLSQKMSLAAFDMLPPGLGRERLDPRRWIRRLMPELAYEVS